MKTYPDIDPETLGAHYEKHIVAMTVERLDSKADIAAQLALRDQEIERLQAALAAATQAQTFAGFKVVVDPSMPGDAMKLVAAQAQPEVEALYREVGRKMVEITTTVRGLDEWLCVPELWLQCMQERDEALRKLAAPTTGKREPLSEVWVRCRVCGTPDTLERARHENQGGPAWPAHGITGEQR